MRANTRPSSFALVALPPTLAPTVLGSGPMRTPPFSITPALVAFALAASQPTAFAQSRPHAAWRVTLDALEVALRAHDAS